MGPLLQSKLPLLSELLPGEPDEEPGEPEEEPKIWSCPRCTLHNRASATHCEACNDARPAAVQEAPPCPGCHKIMQWSRYNGINGWCCENAVRCGSSTASMGDCRWFCQSCGLDVCSTCTEVYKRREKRYNAVRMHKENGFYRPHALEGMPCPGTPDYTNPKMPKRTWEASVAKWKDDWKVIELIKKGYDEPSARNALKGLKE